MSTIVVAYLTPFDPTGNDWLSIATEMFAEFRTDLTQIHEVNSVDSIHTTLSQTIPSLLSVAIAPSSLSSQTLVDLFKRGIKRDFSAFPTLKDEKTMTSGIVLLLLWPEHRI
jgi:hypothetical protein